MGNNGNSPNLVKHRKALGNLSFHGTIVRWTTT